MRRRPGIQGLQSGAAARVRELEKELACVVGRARAERPPRSRTPTPSSFLQTQFAALGASVSETAAEHVRAQLAEFKAKTPELKAVCARVLRAAVRSATCG